MGWGSARLQFDFMVPVSVGGQFVGLRLVERLEVPVVVEGDFRRRVNENLWFKCFPDVFD